MKISLSLALGIALFCGVMSGVDVKFISGSDVEVIDFRDEPNTFVGIITNLAGNRYSALPGDRAELTKFIYGYLYEVKNTNPEQIKKVQEQLGVLVKLFKVPNPKYNSKTQLIQKLLGPNSGVAIYSHLTPERINLWLSAIALYAYDLTLIKPADFIQLMKLSDAMIDNLLSINPDNFTGTIFEIMAQKVLGENATAQEWLKSFKNKHEESTATFKDFVSGLDGIAQ